MLGNLPLPAASSPSSWSLIDEEADPISDAAKAQSEAIREIVDRMWSALAANEQGTVNELLGQLRETDSGTLSQVGFGGVDLSSDATGASGELLSPGVALKLLPKLWSSSLPVSLACMDSSKCGAATAAIPLDYQWSGAKDLGFQRCLAGLSTTMADDPCAPAHHDRRSPDTVGVFITTPRSSLSSATPTVFSHPFIPGSLHS